MHQEIPPELEDLAKVVVHAAFRVHVTLGPGLLAPAYRACLEIELEKRGVPYLVRPVLPISYAGVTIEGAYRIDLLVGEQLVVEVKALDHLLPVHCAQLLTYLRLSGKRLGLLFNFNTPLMKDGIRQVTL